MQHRTARVKNQRQTLSLLAEQVSKAVWLEEISQIIDSLTKLANCALASGYVGEIKGVEWPVAESINSAMKPLFYTIERCIAGKAESYAELYCLCTRLTGKLLNTHEEKLFYPGSIKKVRSLTTNSRDHS